ncbi:MAG: helix-turn-helix domain-containing protein [Pseudomonadota bacterium]
MLSFEIYVGRGFRESEAAGVAQTLDCANEVLGQVAFSWKYVSETPGLIAGSCGMIARAEPLVRDHGLSDVLVVTGGRSGSAGLWYSRLRQMTRLARAVVLLSEAATAYIQRTNAPRGNVTTHWRDAIALTEAGDHPSLTNRLMETSGGVMTCAGSGATTEMIISLITPYLAASDVAELSNRLLLPVVRTAQADQPRDITAMPALTDTRLKAAVEAMEHSLDSPLNIGALAQNADISTRHLERMFKQVFNQTPARFYKQLRTKKARALVEETQMSMVDIAIATGFTSSSALNLAIKREYGMTATRLRARRKSPS